MSTHLEPSFAIAVSQILPIDPLRCPPLDTVCPFGCGVPFRVLPLIRLLAVANLDLQPDATQMKKCSLESYQQSFGRFRLGVTALAK